MENQEITSLYKYRGFNTFSLQCLINEVAWFSKPSSFNDPFDCGIYLDENKLCESVQKAVHEVYLKIGKKIDEIPSEHLKIIPEDKDAFLQIQSGIYNLIQNIGIFSLSSINDDILMWAHYADSHRGFCIEYSREPGNILWENARPVRYQETLPSLSVQDVTREPDGLYKLLLTKSAHWSYEKEWRLFGQPDKALQFPCKIKSIIFGLGMSKENRYTIQKIFENRDVIFNESTKDKNRFSVCISEL